MKLTLSLRFFPMLLPIASLWAVTTTVHEARAHSRWLPSGSLPSMRNTNSGNKSADGVCGLGARNASPVVLQAGQDLTVQWEETIDHPGYFRIAFSPGSDQGYDANVNTRALIFIESPDPAIGIVCVIPIGITEISSISIQVYVGQTVTKGQALGWFSYGG